MIKLKEYKALTEHKSIKKGQLPKKVFIPLLQHFGKPCDSILVKPGDLVKTGQMIATSQGGLFSPVHSSISGKVISIIEHPHPLLGKAKTIVIESGSGDEKVYGESRSQSQVDSLTKDEIRQIVFDAGIVGLGGAGFPTHVKLNSPKTIDTFILNGVECEPYLTTDYRLMLERTQGIINGVQLILKVLEPKNIIVAIEDNKKEAIEKIRKEIPSGWSVKVLETRYPQGGEKQLIKSCLDKEVPRGKLPFDVGVVVNNVATAYAIYEAVYNGKPLIEKVVTVSGTILENPSNLEVRIGTPIKDLIEECGLQKEKAVKIIMGGPMMGVSQFDLEVPVTKGTSGIILLGKSEVEDVKEEHCLRCGDCVVHCPMGLMPSMISQAIIKNRLDLAQEYGLMDCIECGCCSYVCPANKNLMQSIKYAKQRVKDSKAASKK